MTQPINTDDGKKKTMPSPKAPRGRPRTGCVKDHWVSFRVTSEEYFVLIDKAERSGMSAGEYARSRSMRGIARAKKNAASPGQLFDEQTTLILHELRRQGVNLNQLMHLCHRHQLPPPVGVAELVASLTGLWQKLMP